MPISAWEKHTHWQQSCSRTALTTQVSWSPAIYSINAGTLNFKITMNCVSWLQRHSTSKIGGGGGGANIKKSDDTNSSQAIQNFQESYQNMFQNIWTKNLWHKHELSDHIFQLHTQHQNQIYLSVSIFSWKKICSHVRILSSL